MPISKLSSDIKENLGPKPSSNQRFSISHWNSNGISAHNYIKISLLRAYISTHKFDVICISETYLDSDRSDDENNLKIAGYNLTLTGPGFLYQLQPGRMNHAPYLKFDLLELGS